METVILTKNDLEIRVKSLIGFYPYEHARTIPNLSIEDKSLTWYNIISDLLDEHEIKSIVVNNKEHDVSSYIDEKISDRPLLPFSLEMDNKITLLIRNSDGNATYLSYYDRKVSIGTELMVWKDVYATVKKKTS